MKNARAVWLIVVLSGSLSACGLSDPGDQASELQPKLDIGAEESIGLEVDRATLAFRADGDEFHARFSTHEAVVRSGSIRVTPLQQDGPYALAGAPVSFSTTSVRRGSVELLATGRTGIQQDGSLRIDRGSVAEVLENRQDGVEQSWHFAEAPSGRSDLVVAVAVTGHQVVDRSDSGLHFLTPEQLGVSYSNALWIDAAGTTWDVPVAWNGREIVMSVPDAILARSVYPAVLDPVIGAEAAVDTAVPGYTGARARDPSISWSGTRYLAVWRDDRTGRASEIYGARIYAGGGLIDTKNFVIANNVVTEAEPVVTWTGTEWLVAWTTDDGNGAVDVAAATVSAGAAVTQLGAIAGTAAFESNPKLASNGSGALLVWQADSDVRGAVFSAGSFGAPFDIAVTAAAEGSPAAAGATGGDYLVAWHEGASPGEDIRAQLVTSAGALSGGVIAAATASGSQTTPAVAFDGTDFMLAWRDKGDIWGGRVSTAGAPLDGVAGVVISTNTNLQGNPAISCDPASCLVAWEDRRDLVNLTYGVYGQRVGFDMSMQGAEIAIDDAVRNQNHAAIAAQASGFMVLWEDQEIGISVAMRSRVSASGSVLDAGGLLVNRGVNNAQSTPAYARGPNSQFAVWADSRTFGDDIMARRYSATGAKQDTGALTVGSAQYDQTAPSADFDGTQYVVVWADARNPTYDIYATLLSEGGVASADFPVTNADRHQIGADVASGGGVSLAVWQDRRTPANAYDLMGAIITPAGAIGVADIAICQTTGDQERPAVAWDPSSSVFVVAWADRRGADADIYAARVQPDGTVLDACGVLVSGAAGDQLRPNLATSGPQLLATWEDYRDDLLGDVYGSRLDTAGAALNVLDSGAGLAVATGASAQTSPTVTGIDNGRWGLAWVDDVNETTSGTDIVGNTMLSTGGLLGAQYVISANPEYETGPSFQSGIPGTRRAYLVYQRARLDIGSMRVVRRAITHDP